MGGRNLALAGLVLVAGGCASGDASSASDVGTEPRSTQGGEAGGPDPTGPVGDAAPRNAETLRARAREGMRFVYRIEATGAEAHVREVEIVEVTDEGFRSRNVYRSMDGAPLGDPIEGGLTWEEAIHLSLFPHGHDESWNGVHQTRSGEVLRCRMYESRDQHEGDAVVTRACFHPDIPVPLSHEVRRNGRTLQRMTLIDHRP